MTCWQLASQLLLNSNRSLTMTEDRQLQEQIQALRFELESLKNERDHEALRHQNAIRSLEKRFQASRLALLSELGWIIAVSSNISYL